MEARKVIPLGVFLAAAGALVAYGASQNEIATVTKTQERQEAHLVYQDKSIAAQDREIAILQVQLLAINAKLDRIETKLDAKK